MPRAIVVRFADLRRAEGKSPERPALADVDAMLIVADTVNTAPGSRGMVRIADARLERLAADDQVRTVSSR